MQLLAVYLPMRLGNCSLLCQQLLIDVVNIVDEFCILEDCDDLLDLVNKIKHTE